MIQYVISVLVIGWLFFELKYNKSKIETAKQLYFHSWKSIALAVPSIVFLISSVVLLQEYTPNWMDWGWTKLFSNNSTNVITAPTQVIKVAPTVVGIDFRYVGIIGFWVVLGVLLPSFAKIEEKLFRHKVHSWKKVIIRSFVFGFVHMVMGISIFIALVLSVVGLFFHLRYKSTYTHYVNNGYDESQSEKLALVSASSYHAVYNFIIVTLLTISYIVVFYYEQ